MAAKLVGSSFLMSILSIGIAISVFFFYDNLFWATFLFIFAASPAGFFDPYTFGLDIGIVLLDFSQLLFIALLIKVLNIKPVFPRFYKPFLIVLLLVIIINVLNGAFAGITDWHILFRGFKLILPFSFIYIFPRVIRDENDFRYFFSMIFPFVFIAFAAQLLIFILGVPPSVAILGWELDAEKVIGEVAANEQLSRYVFSILLLTMALMGSMYYLNTSGKMFNKYYLGLIMFICFFSIVLSGTRSWTIGLGTSIFLWALISLKRIKKFIFPGLVIFLLVFFMNHKLLVINHQLNMAITRIETFGLFMKGDLTAGETSSRFDIYGPTVMKAFHKINPIIGAGYSEFYFKNTNGHVGHQDLLLQSGYLGYILLNIFILYLIIRLILHYFRNPYTSSSGALAAASLILLGLYIVLPGLAIISYIASPTSGTFYGVYLTFVGFFSYRTRLEKYLIKSSGINHN